MEKIEKLRKIFIKERIDGYIIPKNDIQNDPGNMS